MLLKKLFKFILDCSVKDRIMKATDFLLKYLQNELVAFLEEVPYLFCLGMVTSGLEETLNL